MNSLILAAVDVVAALILAFGLYYPRHRRRDLVVAFLGVNVGVLAVTSVLGGAEIAAGLGLGLFGVLSIIRLRSSEISQREVAYYFSALAMGLIGGLATTSPLLPSILIGLILTVMWLADHPALLARSRHQVVRLDRAIADEDELRAELAARLDAAVTAVNVQQLDLVNDSTLVDVRYRTADAPSRRRDGRPAAAAPQRIGEGIPSHGVRREAADAQLQGGVAANAATANTNTAIANATANAAATAAQRVSR